MNILLIAGSLLIWGWIASLFVPSDEQISEATVDKDVDDVPSQNVHAAPKLKLDYDDPFLKNSEPKAEAIKPIAPTIDEHVAKKPEEAPQWPPVKYFGSIVNRGTTSKHLGLVSISDQSYLVENRQVFGDLAFTVKQFNADSITLAMNNESKVFYSNSN